MSDIKMQNGEEYHNISACFIKQSTTKIHKNDNPSVSPSNTRFERPQKTGNNCLKMD